MIRPSTTVMRFLCASALLAAATLTFVSAQSQTPPQQSASPRFEVASVKPNNSGGVLVLLPPGAPGRYQVINESLQSMIQRSFSVQSFQIVNAPDWTKNERFDVTANIPAGVQLAPGVESAMLRALLEERFKLVTHRETRELQVHALVIARADGKLAPGLEPASPECAPGGRRRLGPGPDGRPQLPPPGQRPCDTSGGSGSIRSGYLSMEGLARMLSARMGQIVLDRTGLAGQFQIELTFTPIQLPNVGANPTPASTVVDPNLPSLLTALQEQLGLKLESTRAPVEVLVIDSVDRPTPN